MTPKYGVKIPEFRVLIPAGLQVQVQEFGE